MLKRLIFGPLMIGVLAGLFWLDWHIDPRHCNEPLAAVLMALIALAMFEVWHLLGKVQVRLLTGSAILGAWALATWPVWSRGAAPLAGGAGLMAVASLIVSAVFLEQMIRHRLTDAIRQVAGTTFAVAYLGVGGAMIVLLREVGMASLILFLAAVKAADSGAYFVGVAIGKHKMIPWLSPGKSWEGLVGGIGGSIGVTALVCRLAGLGLAPWQICVFGASMALIGQFGDLCESLLKRAANVKDSGGVMPGFGGLLDLMDSPLIAAGPAWLMLHSWL